MEKDEHVGGAGGGGGGRGTGGGGGGKGVHVITASEPSTWYRCLCTSLFTRCSPLSSVRWPTCRTLCSSEYPVVDVELHVSRTAAVASNAGCDGELHASPLAGNEVKLNGVCFIAT